MKRTLLILLTVVLFAAMAAAQDQAKVVSLADLKFDNVPDLPACMKAAVLHGDPGSDQGVTLMAKGAAGCKVPWHFHSSNEELGVVSGALRMEMKDGKPQTMGLGAYGYMPAKAVHRASCVTACTFFVGSSGKFAIHYVDDSGKEISSEEALKAAKPAAGAPAKKKEAAPKQ